MRLIDADEAISLLNDLAYRSAGDKEHLSHLMFASSFIETAPTVDAEPVVHAHWCSEDGECSHCGRSLSEIMDSDSFFAVGFNLCDVKCCLWCGAKMDEEVNDRG